MFGHQAFPVAGLVAWNLLPDYLQDSLHSFDSFFPGPETFIFFSMYSALEAFRYGLYYKICY